MFRYPLTRNTKAIKHTHTHKTYIHTNFRMLNELKVFNCRLVGVFFSPHIGKWKHEGGALLFFPLQLRPATN